MNKNYDYKRLTPFKWFVLQNFPFIDEDFDAITNYQLFCKLGEEINKIIDSQNIVGEQAETLTNAFIELQNYVNDYFKNLDVQDEINNKLNEMAEDGTLANIIENYTTIPQINEIITEGGLDRIKATGKFLTNQSSWLGYMNTKYLADNATRFYLIPKNKVTEGVGGCLKIFADNYFDNQDYRDLGIYFSADQNNDKGYYGNGVNWINVKVLDDGSYNGKHPDLGFSFQDGKVVAGRITCFNTQRAMWTFGKNLPTLYGTDLIAEFQKSIGLIKNSRIRFEKNASTNQFNDIFSNDDGDLNFSISSKEKKYISGNLINENSENKFDIKNALVTTNRVNIASATNSINTINSNRVVIGNTEHSTIDSISGNDGQEITIINVGDGTTIQNNSSIHLLNNTNFSMTLNSTLTLININGTWYEKCRSVNS